MKTLLIILAIILAIWLAGALAIFLWTTWGNWPHWRSNAALALSWPILLILALTGGIHVI